MDKNKPKTILLLASLVGIFLSFYSNAESEKFNLITVLYNETNEERIAEYLTCLEKNLVHDRIDKIHIIYDTSKDNEETMLLDYIKNKELPITYINGRASYAFCFDLANKLYPNSRIILSNADIYFNETLYLLDDYDLTNKFLALTRWTVLKNGLLEIFKQYNQSGNFSKEGSESSQDVWIFSTPIKDFHENTIQIGTMGCDTTITYYAHASGLNVINPCLSIQCCHLHLSETRNYNIKDRPYAKEPKLTAPWKKLL